LRILLIELGVLHHDAVPGGVVGDYVDDDSEAALVRFGDEAFQIIFCAVRRIDGVIILHGIGAADASLLLELAHWMDRHDPKNGDTQIFEVIEPLFDASKIAGRRERARVDLVNDGGLYPSGDRMWSRLLSKAR